MRLKWIGLAAIACCLISVSRPGFADTLQLTGTGGTSVNVGSESVYVYPYDFSVNGSSSTTQLMCLNFNEEITQGEQWNVNIESISQAAGGNTTLLNEYEEDAYLYSLITPTTSQSQQTLIQFAVWDILDPSGVQSSSDPEWTGNEGAINSLLNEASNGVADADAGFFNQFEVYIPVGNYTDNPNYPDGTPQSFIGTAPTPEPASLALLGTSLLGAVGVLKRRTRKA